AGEVMKPLRKLAPARLVKALGVLLHPGAQLVAPGVIAQFGAADAEHAGGCGQAAPVGHFVERRNKFARGEVAGGAEDDDDAGIGGFRAWHRGMMTLPRGVSRRRQGAAAGSSVNRPPSPAITRTMG